MEDLFSGILLLITMIIGFILYEFFAAKKDDLRDGKLGAENLNPAFCPKNSLKLYYRFGVKFEVCTK